MRGVHLQRHRVADLVGRATGGIEHADRAVDIHLVLVVVTEILGGADGGEDLIRLDRSGAAREDLDVLRPEEDPDLLTVEGGEIMAGDGGDVGTVAGRFRQPDRGRRAGPGESPVVSERTAEVVTYVGGRR